MVFEATSNVGDSWGGADESSHSLIILLDGQIAPFSVVHQGIAASQKWPFVHVAS